VLDSDGTEHSRDSEEEKALMRKIAGESITLLKNKDATLPLQAHNLKKIAIIGGNAKRSVYSGGGSATLKPSYFVTPYDGIVNALPKDVQVTYSEGARGQFTIFISIRSWLEPHRSVLGSARP
jgi:beta-glucosidase